MTMAEHAFSNEKKGRKSTANSLVAEWQGSVLVRTDTTRLPTVLTGMVAFSLRVPLMVGLPPPSSTVHSKAAGGAATANDTSFLQ